MIKINRQKSIWDHMLVVNFVPRYVRNVIRAYNYEVPGLNLLLVVIIFWHIHVRNIFYWLEESESQIKSSY